jgi:hypothetical protein
MGPQSPRRFTSFWDAFGPLEHLDPVFSAREVVNRFDLRTSLPLPDSPVSVRSFWTQRPMFRTSYEASG